MSSPSLAGVTDTVSDVWTKNAPAVQELAATAAGFATGVAVAAAEHLDDLPERVVGLAAAAKDRIVPPPRRSVKPWVLLVAAIATFAVVAWYLRRRAGEAAVDVGPGGQPNPVREHTDTATSAVGT